MKAFVRVLFSMLFVAMGLSATVAFANNNHSDATQPQAPRVVGPIVSAPIVAHQSNVAARDLPRVNASDLERLPHEINPRRYTPNNTRAFDLDMQDALVPLGAGSSLTSPDTLISFEGISYVSGGSGVPPDTIGDVGPNHYVQMVNSTFAMFDKNGTLLAGPSAINSLWNGVGGRCDLYNRGDPVVLYDQDADRWLISQFAFTSSVSPPPYSECIAISQTPDPTGSYILYEFPINDYFPDYPKLGVWHDAYYMATNEDEGRVGIFAFDRANMLAGNPATHIKYSILDMNYMLPSDIDGATLPPAGSPNYFYTFMDSTYWGGGSDRLEVWTFDVDFGTPANSVFTRSATINIAPFTYTVCGYFVLACIPQPSPGQLLDSVSEWPMWRFQYRNFGTYETLVGNFTVDVGGDHGGIRWFELRKSGAGNWALYQEGTHAPDAHHRFMGSIAMDGKGNIALGYSASSNTLSPTIRYATRATSDTLGTLQTEATMYAGNGVQLGGFNRWGDYSAMSVDPSDDCTFWYTNEYYPVNANFSWHTRIGAFKMPDCVNDFIYIYYYPLIAK